MPRQGFYTRPTCPDCGGTEYRTVQGEYIHSRTCPRRKAPTPRVPAYRDQSEAQQDKEAETLTQGICSHGYDDWTECAGCTWMADHWDDEDIKRTGALW
jgi:hypothetical protein